MCVAALAWVLIAAAAVAPAAKPGAFLGELTWPEAEVRLRQAAAVVLPFGPGAKEHGPHLPMNADEKVMEHLCREAVRAEPVVVAPPILHGWLPAFRQFPGTEVSDPDVFRKYVQEVASSLVRHGAKRMVLLNTSIGLTGDPTRATAEKGRRALEIMTRQWLRALEAFFSESTR